MNCTILHQSPGRLRVHMAQRHMTLRQADILESWLCSVPGVKDVKVYDRTRDAVILYAGDGGAVRRALAVFRYDDPEALALTPERSGRELNRAYQDRLFFMIARRVFKKLFVPAPIRHVLAVLRGARYILKGLRSLKTGSVRVELLDAIAIGVSLLRGDFETASSVMFMLGVGDLLEEWAHKKSVDDLARTMSLDVENVWLRCGEQEVLTPLHRVQKGDRIVVRMGSMIPLDGTVVSGEAMVNQASITGESMPVRRAPGSTVYAGTVVEEGECTVLVTAEPGTGRYDRIVQMVEESEKLKSATEARASRLADKLVPYTLAGTAATYLITRNATKAVSVLMVDFSCALKLSMPLAFLSAMRECSRHHITVKGGLFLEAAAAADTVVFDKTGTLTYATPRVAKVVPFGGNDETEVLRIAACLEEHFPHSIASAVVQEAKNRGIVHEEQHATVNYIVAHGISSSLGGRELLIGSYHFIFEDGHCVIPEGEEDKFRALPPEYSLLFLAAGGELMAAICIEDPLRPEAPEVIRQLRKLGVTKLVMMTGDGKKTAEAVAARVGVDEFRAEVLPEDKAAFIRAEHEAGRRVMMIGDGINDSPALSEADVGIAISSGAAIAREVADITVAAEGLDSLLTLRRLSMALQKRIGSNYRSIVGFNLLLIALGVAGILPPTTSALLHNGSTLAIGLKSMTNLLEE